MSFEKPIKYVFHLNPDNARYFKNMPQEERHALINEMIENYYKKRNTLADSKFIKKNLTYIAVTFVAVFLCVAILIGIVKLAFASSKTNEYFTQGFVKYGQTHQKRY